jgi:hypothetical protein
MAQVQVGGSRHRIRHRSRRRHRSLKHSQNRSLNHPSSSSCASTRLMLQPLVHLCWGHPFQCCWQHQQQRQMLLQKLLRQQEQWLQGLPPVSEWDDCSCGRLLSSQKPTAEAPHRELKAS